MTEYDYTYYNSDMTDEICHIQDRKFSFEYQFVAPISHTGNYKSRVPHKIVKTEQYIWGGLSLIANLGGILSMNIGFSFLAALEFFAVKFQKVSTSRSCFTYTM